ncbi:hypothetical protein KFE98_10420 [bacterium SCSIO 12741]|nr:hypothetical protein KFE98_10420 [bacterium SCSIO 12741]
MRQETLHFHFFSLKFTPYKHLSSNENSNSILRGVITYLTKELLNGNGHLIDKNRGNGDGSRELFLTSAVFMHKENRIRCSMALLRSGRAPKIKPVNKFELVPIDTIGSIAEETHFFIDYSRSTAVLCVEFNYHGPRISDIEFYFRNVARDMLKLSKATDVDMYMSNKIDNTLAELKNVLNIDIKIQPSKIAQMDKDIVGSYFTGINTIGNRLKPKYIKLEALFQTQGKGIRSSELNKDANSMVLSLLKKFKTRPFNIDCFNNFVVRYEDKDGNEEVFNLLKGKETITLEDVDLDELTKRVHWYELIEEGFDRFMNSL